MLSKVLGNFAFHSDSAYSNDDSCELIQKKSLTVMLICMRPYLPKHLHQHRMPEK